MPADHLKIYSGDYFSGAQGGFGYADYDRDKAPMEATFFKYLDRIEAAGAKGGMLDVGAATGFFLDLARRRGWSVHGVEPSSYAAQLGQAKGIDVRAGTLEDQNFPAGSFDAVTLWDVIEHLPDPNTTLQRIHALLKSGGVLAINTPDSASLLAHIMGLNWHLVTPPEHLNLFHRKSIRTLLEREGYEVLQVANIGKTFTVQYVLQILNHWTGADVFNSAAQWARSRRIGSWGIPINLLDNMFVLARKRES